MMSLETQRFPPLGKHGQNSRNGSSPANDQIAIDDFQRLIDAYNSLMAVSLIFGLRMKIAAINMGPIIINIMPMEKLRSTSGDYDGNLDPDSITQAQLHHMRGKNQQITA